MDAILVATRAMRLPCQPHRFGIERRHGHLDQRVVTSTSVAIDISSGD